MRVSLTWLREFIDLPTGDPIQLGRVFDYLGHAVESIEVFDVAWSGVRIGEVVEVGAHPNADKIRVARVDVGDASPHQIICGAWNFEAGARVPVALPGAVLPGGFEIGKRAIRGVESHGMICSERELGLGEDHEGIIVLDGNPAIGDPFESLLELPDVVFDLEVTNNRPDVMSMIGVARELAAWYDIDLRMPVISLPTVPGEPKVGVTISAPDGCNRFTAREVRGITSGKSPLWMQQRLHKAGVRAISNVVDVTNYVMLELGHPLHAFDADVIAGNSLDVRWAREGETLETLDGAVRRLTPQDLVIVDGDGPTSLAAIMGGARSEVAATTRNVLMEAAHWDPPTVMYSSRRHDLQSEASKRFERGVDPNLAPMANDRACQLLTNLAGGDVVATQIDIVANPSAPVVIELATSDVQRLLGTRFSTDPIAELLGRLQLEVVPNSERLTVTVPTYRPDLTRPADLVEEVARLADFDTFPETLPTGPAGGLSAEQTHTRTLVTTLRGLGLHQAVNLPFVSPDELAAFAEEVGDVVSVRNPLRDDQAKLRQSLLPGLLRNVRDNLNRGAGAVALFEIGRVFFARPWPEDDRVPDQPNRVAVAITGPFGFGGPADPPPTADATTALAAVAAIATRMGLDVARAAAQPPGYHPTRTAALTINGRPLGYAGETHPGISRLFEIDSRVAIVELELAPLVAARGTFEMTPISNYPHVDFDLSFEVPPGLPGGDLVSATARASDLLEAVTIFDDFVHPETARRSIALHFRLRASDRTLSRQEIERERDALVTAAAALGAQLRSA